MSNTNKPNTQGTTGTRGTTQDTNTPGHQPGTRRQGAEQTQMGGKSPNAPKPNTPDEHQPGTHRQGAESTQMNKGGTPATGQTSDASSTARNAGTASSRANEQDLTDEQASRDNSGTDEPTDDAQPGTTQR